MHCDHKHPYATPQAAARAARGRALDGVTYLRVYACPECGMYHLTSKAPIEPGEAAKRQSASGEAAGWGLPPDRMKIT
jgi:hypothetical protein